MSDMDEFAEAQQANGFEVTAEQIGAALLSGELRMVPRGKDNVAGATYLRTLGPTPEPTAQHVAESIGWDVPEQGTVGPDSSATVAMDRQQEYARMLAHCVEEAGGESDWLAILDDLATLGWALEPDPEGSTQMWSIGL